VPIELRVPKPNFTMRRRDVGTIMGIVLGAAVAAVSLPAHADAATVFTASADEQRAIGVVKDWASAMNNKDEDKALSYVDDHIQYRDDPFQTSLKSGTAQLQKDLAVMLRGLSSMTIVTAYAVGSEHDTLVLVKRVDEFSLGGKKITTPMGAYFRVKDGKILEWLDTPLKQMPPPPK
jgi:limonene-1,2-epoxide hydrolase